MVKDLILFSYIMKYFKNSNEKILTIYNYEIDKTSFIRYCFEKMT